MHIGFVVYGGLDGTSGGYRYDRQLVDHLRDTGDDVTVIVLPRRSYPRQLTDGCSRSLRRRLDRPFDVLLQDQLCHPSLWRHNPHLRAPGAVVTLVHLLRSPDPQSRVRPLYRAVERGYLRTVDGAVCTSAFTHNRTRRLADVPTTVAYPAGRTEGAALSPATVEERAGRNPFRILFVGNLHPRKGADTLLSALARLDGNWQATVVGAAGEPAYARSLRQQARAYGIVPRVTFTGEVSDDRLEAAFRDAHVLAVPSRYEGFGMVYLEAMEYGVVPVAGSVGGADEFVADGTNGLIVDPDDVTTLADRLADLQADRERLRRYARAALSTADAHPGWADSMEHVRRFLVRTLERSASCRSDTGTTGADTRLGRKPTTAAERSGTDVGGGDT
ncbi:MAG: glycosyltransferase family 4 protein [Halovenus sp.]